MECFHKSKELTCYEKVEFVEMPFEGNSMPGYLVLPDHIDKETPVIIYVPGATGFKEENYTAQKNYGNGEQYPSSLTARGRERPY